MRILMVGDVMLGRLVNQSLKNAAPHSVWGDTLSLFRTADLRVCNLECVLSDWGEPWSATHKVFHFRSDAKNAAVLREAGLDVISIANNHVLDYGYEALHRMLRVLDQAGIRYAGAGRTRAEACRPAVIDRAGMRLGMLAFTDNEPTWEAGDDHPGTCYFPADAGDDRSAGLLSLVAGAARTVDYLIVSAHWGPNWGYEPPDTHRALGRALMDAGADVVFGHSPHVFRGIELYRGKPILYSTGDFIDDYAVDEIERNDESFIFMLDIHDRAAVWIALYPTIVRNLRALLAKGEEARAIAAKMESLCATLGTGACWDPAGTRLLVPIGQAPESER